jgi:hypothetical protein
MLLCLFIYQALLIELYRITFILWDNRICGVTQVSVSVAEELSGVYVSADQCTHCHISDVQMEWNID